MRTVGWNCNKTYTRSLDSYTLQVLILVWVSEESNGEVQCRIQHAIPTKQMSRYPQHRLNINSLRLGPEDGKSLLLSEVLQ
jgi:hypothetical protein